MPFQALLFDLDGTLLDTAPEFERAVQRLLAGRNRPLLPASAIRARVSDGARALVQLALGVGEKEQGFAAARDELLELYGNELGKHTAPFPGIPALLEKLKQRQLAWGVVTNKPVRFAEPLLAQMQLQPQVLVCPEHVAQAKPHPEALLRACAHLDCAPAQALCIGDHQRDIQAGRNAGTATAAALWGYISPQETPTDWGADYYVKSPQTLNALLDQLLPACAP